MNFKDRYCLNAASTLPENKDKIVISNDAFAVGEMIEELIKVMRGK